MMDIVIPYKQTSSDELRYALRSIEENLDFNKIYIIGDKPSWAKGVTHIPYNQALKRYQNIRRIMEIVLIDHRISDNFIYTHDDIFIMKPVKHFNYHRGSIDELRHEVKGQNLYGMLNTKDSMTFCDNPMSYELHIPTIYNKLRYRLTAEALKSLPNNNKIHSRTLYGNLFNLGGKKIKDVKIYDDKNKIPRGCFISTTEKSFAGKAGKYIRARFPNKSRLEK